MSETESEYKVLGCECNLIIDREESPKVKHAPKSQFLSLHLPTYFNGSVASSKHGSHFMFPFPSTCKTRFKSRNEQRSKLDICLCVCVFVCVSNPTPKITAYNPIPTIYLPPSPPPSLPSSLTPSLTTQIYSNIPIRQTNPNKPTQNNSHHNRRQNPRTGLIPRRKRSKHRRIRTRRIARPSRRITFTRASRRIRERIPRLLNEITLNDLQGAHLLADA